MISFFPEPYPDELLYSVIARYHQRSGYALLASTIDDIYQHRTVRPSFEFLNAFTQDAIAWLTKTTSFEDIVQENTMFPFYAHFLPLDRQKRAFEALCRQDGHWDNLLSIRKIGERHFRYCPLCASEDRREYGETYWHRRHQIQRLKVCSYHGCYLKDTAIRISKAQSPSLYNAESVIPPNVTSEACSDKEIALANYVCEVLSSTVKCVSGEVGSFLHYRLDNKYKSTSGVARDLTAIYDGFYGFYDGMEVPSQWQIQKIFNGSLRDAFFVCQIAFWEGVSIEELTSNKPDYIDVDTKSFYEHLSSKYNVDIDTIIQLGTEISKHLYKTNRIQSKPGRRGYDYKRMDIDLLPRVKCFIKEFYLQDARPARLSVGKVEKALSLPPKRISKLPQCKAYVVEHIETQSEYWAREVVWAVKTLQERQEPLNWKHIRNLTNMRPIDLKTCIKHIDDKEVSRIAEGIIDGS